MDRLFCILFLFFLSFAPLNAHPIWESHFSNNATDHVSARIQLETPSGKRLLNNRPCVLKETGKYKLSVILYNKDNHPFLLKDFVFKVDGDEVKIRTDIQYNYNSLMVLCDESYHGPAHASIILTYTYSKTSRRNLDKDPEVILNEKDWDIIIRRTIE